MTRILINGCMGRMGRAISALADNDPDCEVVGGADVSNDRYIFSYPFYSELSQCEAEADVAIDVSLPDAAPFALRFCVGRKLPLIICTTGLSEETENEIQEAASRIAIFKSANMSLGVSLLANLARRTAKVLSDSGFDIEIIERHHNKKLDAPSGTALMLADTINEALHGEKQVIFDRSKRRQHRGSHEIGIHAIRGGTIVGEHSVVFAGTDEVIELSHSVQSRDAFAAGAIKAALFLHGKGPGLYTMDDLFAEV
jgi:4-hydroxy-tetrahydrodipicolinate reductase